MVAAKPEEITSRQLGHPDFLCVRAGILRPKRHMIANTSRTEEAQGLTVHHSNGHQPSLVMLLFQQNPTPQARLAGPWAKVALTLGGVRSLTCAAPQAQQQVLYEPKGAKCLSVPTSTEPSGVLGNCSPAH